MPAKSQISNELRNQIILKKSEGQKSREIASIFSIDSFLTIFLDFFLISESSVSKILKRHKETGNADILKRSGRPPILTKRDISFVMREVNSTPNITTEELSNMVSERKNLKIAQSTIRTMLINTFYFLNLAEQSTLFLQQKQT